MELVEVYTGSNCGAWVLRYRGDLLVAVDPWLFEELPHDRQRPRPTPWLVSTAFWGGRAERLRWAATITPNRGGALIGLRDDPDRFAVSPGDVAALLELLDSRVAA